MHYQSHDTDEGPKMLSVSHPCKREETLAAPNTLCSTQTTLPLTLLSKEKRDDLFFDERKPRFNLVEYVLNLDCGSFPL